MRYLLLWLFFAISPLLCSASTIVQLNIGGVIGPASSSYLDSGMAHARAVDADAVLIVLDTPGGLSSSMREMIQQITNSAIPVITYVYPKGARAASAGTYLLYASHVAAMSEGTNLGAATPVNIAPSYSPKDMNGSALTSMEKKVINDAMAYIKSLAQLHERNATWALDAVREGKSLAAKDALLAGVIDIIASDIPALLDALEGRMVRVGEVNATLHTKAATLTLFEPDWKMKFLGAITDPTIAYMFMLIAIYGIFFELMNPGALFPGIIGAVCGVIALYALNILPFNYAGLLLMALGVAFMVAEVFVAGFGILGVAGVAAFAFGSLLLFDAQTLGEGVSLPIVIAFSLVSLGFVMLTVRLLISSRAHKIESGREEMTGAQGEVVEVLESGYRVRCHGELWHATSDTPLQTGAHVKVVSLTGLILKVTPIKE